MFLLISLLVIGAAVLFYLYQTRNHGYWVKRGVPCASGLHWLYGNFKSAIYRDKHFCQVFQDIYNEQDVPYIGIMNFSKPAILLKDPELIKAVLTTDFNSFQENEFKVDKNHDFLVGYNPFFLKGEEWKMSRGHASPMTTFAKLKTYYPNMVKVADNMMNYITNQNKDGDPVDMEMRDMAGMFTTDVVANALLGVQNDTFKDKNSLFGKITKNLLATGTFEGVRAMIYFMCPQIGEYFGMRISSKEVEDVLMPLTKNIIKEREQSGEVRNDIFQQIIAYKDNDKLGVFTDKYIASQCYGFLLDGYETSSDALCFALFELAWHQEIQDRLRSDINTLLNNNNELTIDHIDKLKYLDMIVSESLRKFPPLSSLFKSCTIDYALSNTLTIKKDINVVIPVYALHRDEKYFPNPEEFDPERFTDEAVAKRNKFVYLPFGEGPRKCVGMRFGMLQVKLAITSIVRHFKIIPSPKSSYPVHLDPVEFMTKPLNGAWVRFKPL